ncbi:MAG: AMP-binding protein, partial [Burkholderiales bacterium]|nr:AMP-binding protein [Burkholderiales bacterium]
MKPGVVIERPTGALKIAAAHARGGLAGQVHIPETSVFYNLEVAARRFPTKAAIHFLGASTTYSELLQEVERMAGFLQTECGVGRGDRVAVFSQNCPQFIVAYLAIMRADAVLVPVNAMLLHDELQHIIADSGSVAAFVAQELLGRMAPLLGNTSLRHLIVHAYGDALGGDDAGLSIPDGVRTCSATDPLPAGATRWSFAMARDLPAAPPLAGPDDLCMLPYTSGTTGAPKACIHTHRTILTSVVGNTIWRRVNGESVFLCVAPLFHLLGLQNNVNAALYAGATIVLMPRWDREMAAVLIERHRVTYWAALPAMLTDFFALPGIEQRDLGSLAMVTGGGAATPDLINKLLAERFGLDYIEGYGLTETAAFLCANPVHAPKRGCLGVPTFGVDLRLLDPETLEPVALGAPGEIV